MAAQNEASELNWGVAAPLATWKVPAPAGGFGFAYELCQFSPSGRLMFLSDRLVDLYSGNSIALKYPAPQFYYVPLTDTHGIGVINRSRFAKAELNFETGEVEVDWDSEEPLPNNANNIIGHGFGRFSCFQMAENGKFEVSIRNLNAETEAEKWIRFQLDDQPLNINVEGDSVLVLVNAEPYAIKWYSIEEKSVLNAEISDIALFDERIRRAFAEDRARRACSTMDYCNRMSFWMNRKLYIFMHSIHSSWEFVVIDPLMDECYAAKADHPAPQWEQPFGYVCPSEYGIVGVLALGDRTAAERQFRAYLISMETPPPLRLLSHFRLLDTGLAYDNLPPVDFVPPLFGQIRYRSASDLTSLADDEP